MFTSYVRKSVSFCLALAVALSPAFSARIVGAASESVDPATVTATIVPGGNLVVTKTVHTPEIPPKPDIIFLADTTGSMGNAIEDVQTNAKDIMDTVRISRPGAQFGAANYKDFNCPDDPFPYKLDQPITNIIADAKAGIDAWKATDGCDVPEAQLNALFQLATDPAAGWRPGSTRIIAWFGDSNGHDPSNGHSLTDVKAALVNTGIRVIAVPVKTGFGNGLDSVINGHHQATEITSATNGVLLPAATSNQVADAILAGLQNLPVQVSWSLSACDPHLTVNLTPASQTVTSGSDAIFTETIIVAPDAPQGTIIHCTVNFLLDGTVTAGFTESINITVPDVTPPTAQCRPTTNPSGKNIPPAGNNGKSGQNPDGFYLLSGKDNVDPNPQIFIHDSRSTFVAGPYASGTKIKLVQAPGSKPNVKPGAGVIDWKIKLKGDALLIAVDASGNASAPASCNVPPPPK